MNGYTGRRSALARRTRVSRGSRAIFACEALEGRQLLSRGMGMEAFGGMGGGGHQGSGMAELGSFGGGRAGAMFGSGGLGLGGGTRDPIFLLTASLLNTGSGTTTPPSRTALSSSAVQTAFQTLQTDLSDDVTVGSKPTHASVGQLQDDLESIRKGTLTGTAATTAIQNDEAAILTSMGLSSTQVGQIQSDLQAVQSAIQTAATSGSASTTTTTTTTGSTTTSTSGSTTSPTPDASSTSTLTPASASATTAPAQGAAAPSSAVQTAFQTLQSDLNSDLSVGAQPTHASIGQVQDDLDAISKGTLTGSAATTAIQTDTAAVLASVGLSQAQITQIQSDQAAVATAIQANSTQSGGSTSSSSSSSVSPTSIAGVEATMQSVQQYVVGLPGLGGAATGGFGFRATDGPSTMTMGRSGGFGQAISVSGSPTFISRADGGGMGMGGPMMLSGGGGGGVNAPMMPVVGQAAASSGGQTTTAAISTTTTTGG